ncbi:hypothetical protein M2345_001515 [Sphingobium sp. B8D3D]|nr:hypothetical protein [Sphingobium sp. B8D3D]MCW2415948.1 hypothetical protein [Sphingobium sp. B8D3A]
MKQSNFPISLLQSGFKRSPSFRDAIHSITTYTTTHLPFYSPR